MCSRWAIGCFTGTSDGDVRTTCWNPIMDLSTITPLILVHNEAPNLERTLSRLRWAQQVVIVDSGSTDASRAIAQSFANVIWAVRAFDDFAAQRNFGLSVVASHWVLSMDADFVLAEGFESELAALTPSPHSSAYLASFVWIVLGSPIGRTLYPDRPVLLRRDSCRYIKDGHSERLVHDGALGRLRTPIRHDDRKPIAHWIRSQVGYARLEAEKLDGAPSGTLSIPDRIRTLLFIAPLAVPAYVLVWKGLVLKGLPGWHYCLQRTIAELILSLTLLDIRLGRRHRE